jgi:hypothetical protein
MFRLSQLVLAVAVVGLIVSPAGAQQQRQRGGGGGRGGGFGGGMMSQLTLLTQKSVQEELKLTPDQVEKVTELQRKQQGARQGLADLSQEERAKKMQEMTKETDKAVAGLLKPDQSKRIKQILLQQQGAMAFNTPEVAQAMNFTAEQKQKLKDIQDTATKERQALRGGGGAGGDRQAMAQKIAEITKKTNTEAMALLTAAQKTKWQELTGEPFKGEIVPGGARRPRNDR